MKHNTLWQTTWSKTNYDVLSIGSSNHDSDSADLEKKLTVGIVSVFGAILVGTIIVSLKKCVVKKMIHYYLVLLKCTTIQEE